MRSGLLDHAWCRVPSPAGFVPRASNTEMHVDRAIIALQLLVVVELFSRQKDGVFDVTAVACATDSCREDSA